MVLGVQYFVRDPFSLEHLRNVLRLLDRDGADQHRPPLLMHLFDLFHHSLELRLLVAIDEIGSIVANHRFVGGDHHHLQLVDFEELLGLSDGGTGHARQRAIDAEVVLQRDRRVGEGLLLDLDAFLSLHRLMEPVRPAPARHQPPGELIDDDHLAVIHHILPIAAVEDMRLQGRVQIAGEAVVLRGIEVVDPQCLFYLGDTRLGHADGTYLLIDGVIQFHLEAGHQAGEGSVGLGALLGRAADNQRRARLIDEDVIHLVDDSEVEFPMDAAGQVHRHVVPEVVEAELVVGAVDDVGPVRLDAGAGRQVLHVRHVAHLLYRVARRGVVFQHSDGEAQAVVDGAHPLGVALGQIVVHRHQMGALAFQRVQVQGQGSDQRLSLAGLHLRDLALVEY